MEYIHGCVGVLNRIYGVIVRLNLSSHVPWLGVWRVAPSDVHGKETSSPSEVTVFGCRRANFGVDSWCNKFAISSKALFADCGTYGVSIFCLFTRRCNKSSADLMMCSS